MSASILSKDWLVYYVEDIVLTFFFFFQMFSISFLNSISSLLMSDIPLKFLRQAFLYFLVASLLLQKAFRQSSLNL